MADGIFAAKGLSEQQERFCRFIVEGMNQTDAYKAAGYKAKDDNVAAANASRLIGNAKVAAFIALLNEKANEKAIEATGITKERITQMLLEDRTLARQNAQASAAIQAAMGLAKIHGHIVDHATVKSENINYAIGDQPMNEDEWEREFGDTDALGAPARPPARTH